MYCKIPNNVPPGERKMARYGGRGVRYSGAGIDEVLQYIKTYSNIELFNQSISNFDPPDLSFQLMSFGVDSSCIICNRPRNRHKHFPVFRDSKM